MIQIKEQPNAKIPYLRFLCGVNKERPKEIPVFEENGRGGYSQRVIGIWLSATETVSVFHVLGFGVTQEKAQAMCKRSASEFINLEAVFNSRVSAAA